MTLRSRIAMLLAEFIGTAVLATVAITVSRSQIGIGYFVAIAVGLTLGVLVLVIGNLSGAHLNPAVTLGMWTIRKIPTLQAIAFLAAQMLGGLAAWRLFEYHTNQVLNNIAGKSFEWRVLVAELVGTFVFTFGFAAAVYQGYKGLRLAATIGTAFFVGIVIASSASNAILNPATALATQSWSRAYIFGPLVGSLVGMNLYALLFAPARLAETTANTTAVPSPSPRAASTATTTVTRRKKAGRTTGRKR